MQIRAMTNLWFTKSVNINDPFVTGQLLFLFSPTVLPNLNPFPLPHPRCSCTSLHICKKACLLGTGFPILPLHLQSCLLWHQSFPPLFQSEDKRGIFFFSRAFLSAVDSPAPLLLAKKPKLPFLNHSLLLLVHVVS